MNISIKRTTFSHITELILRNDPISCASLASLSSFTEVTVGKVAKAMLEAGFIDESRAPVSKGRHAVLLAPSDKTRIIFLFFTPRIILTRLTDTLGKVIGQRCEQINDSLTFEENVDISLSRTRDELLDKDTVIFTNIVCLCDTKRFNGFYRASYEGRPDMSLHQFEDLGGSDAYKIESELLAFSRKQLADIITDIILSR